MSDCDECPFRKALEGYLTEHLLAIATLNERVAHLHADVVTLRESIEKRGHQTYPETVTT